MQDILLSTAPAVSASGGATSLSPSGVGAPGQQVSENAGSFGATLAGVVHPTLSSDNLDEISKKLESLGMDPGLLDSLKSMLGGNTLSLDGIQEGMLLPQLSEFLASTLEDLEGSLDQFGVGQLEGELQNGLVSGMTSPLTEDAQNAIYSILSSLQGVVNPAKSIPGLAGGASIDGEGGLSSALVSSITAQLDELKKNLKAESRTAGSHSINVDPNAGLSSSVKGIPSAMEADGEAYTSLNERAFFSLNGDQQFKLGLEGGANADSIDALVDKFVSNGVQKNTATGIKASFTDVQAKLDNAPYSTTVMTGLNDVEWGDEIGQKIVWLTGNAIQAAEIHLNPAELGPIDVKISVQNETAAVTFNAHNASVREMLESNVVRLREMMESNGVELQEVNVDARQGDERYAAKDQQQGSEDGQGQEDDAAVTDEESLSASETSSLSSNIVDYFA